jgi:hypothetical protein
MKSKILQMYARVLHSRDALEAWLDLLAVAWGLGFLILPVPVFYPYLLVGLLPICVGVSGFAATALDLRSVRAFSSFVAVCFWILIAMNFVIRGLVVSTAVTIYLMLALAEAYVFIRISAGFDRGSDDQGPV